MVIDTWCYIRCYGLKSKKRSSSVSKKPYELEYKDVICRLVIDDGRVVAELSRELNIPKATNFCWLRSYKEKNGCMTVMANALNV